jgi:hypothetical protein
LGGFWPQLGLDGEGQTLLHGPAVQQPFFAKAQPWDNSPGGKQ